MKNKKSIIWITIVVIILIAAVVIVKKAKSKDEAAPVAQSYSVVVKTMIPKITEVNLTLPYLAISKNDKDVNLASNISGRVEFVKSSGSQVKKGEIIARLDKTSIISNLASVKSQIGAISKTLENMIATHNRTLELIKVNGASIEQSQKEENMIAEIQSKKEMLIQKSKELNNKISYATIKSPVSGNISKTMVNIGDIAMPGHPIANIRAKNGFYLLIRVPNDLKISGVEVQNKHYNAIPLNSTFNGLSEYKAYTDLSGLTTNDRIEVNVEIFKGKAILLPYDAVLNRNGKSFVLLREGNRAKAKEINIIESGEQGIAISNNELEGKEIIIEKQDILLKLLSGISLKVKED